MYRVGFPDQTAGDPGEERFEVAFDDGRVERFAMHEYGRVYAVPGLYEEVVQRRLGCATPDRIAALLAGAAPAGLRVLDLGAGNGVSGTALAQAGLRPVAAVDLEPQARPATLRDRPGLYELVLTGDIAALPSADLDALRALRPEALALAGALGNDHVGAAALRLAASLLTGPRLVALAFPDYEDDDGLVAAIAPAEELARERYLHRRTVSGEERWWTAALFRLDSTST